MWSFKNVSCSTHNIPCIMQQSIIAIRHGPGTRNSGGLTGNMGRSGAARCFWIVEFSHILDLSHQLAHGRTILFLMHTQFINCCLSCSIFVCATNSSQFFNFLAISCMIFLEEPNSPNSNSPYKLLFYLFEPDLPIDLLDVAEIVEVQILA